MEDASMQDFAAKRRAGFRRAALGVAVGAVAVLGLAAGPGAALAQQAARAIMEVRVVNTAAEAVPVRVQALPTAGDPRRSAFAYFENLGNWNSTSRFAAFTVPEGKRLVIESVSVQGSLPIGVEMTSAAVQAFVNGKFQDYFIAPVFTGTSSGSGVFIASQQTTLYADGGTEVKVFGNRNNVGTDGTTILNVSVQGYLLDCKAAPCN